MNKPNKEMMIEDILNNPDSGLTVYSKEELENMSQTEVWCIWIRR